MRNDGSSIPVPCMRYADLFGRLIAVMPTERYRVRASRFSILTFVMLVACSTYAFAHVVEVTLGQIKPQFQEPHEIVEIYFLAVGRGELVVFGRKLSKSMLIPISVEYVYDLRSAMPRVKVYSKLKQPMPVPGQESCKLRGVSAILDGEGRIIETEAHIWPE
jgi:hypothetical protein